MSYSYPEIRTLLGLAVQRNSFTVPDGSLEIGLNVNIAKDHIVTSRRGFYKYSTPGAGTLNALFFFDGHLLACFASKISYYVDTGTTPNETGTETALSGATVAVSTVGHSRAMLANSNFYFTTDNGPRKLTAYNSTIYPTGMPQGLDVLLRWAPGTSLAQLASGYTTGYRVVFGLTDANSNLILGAPSDITTISNTVIAAVYSSSGGGPYTVTVTSAAHGLASGTYLVFSGALDADANGTYAITVTTLDTFTYSVVADPSSGGLAINYVANAPVRVETTIPSEITTGQAAFVQIYRASVQTIAVGIFGDFKLLVQRNLTTAEITAGRLYYTDSASDTLLGANLYTNENSGEGEARANYKPPYATDMVLFKGYSLYSDCITRQYLNLNVIDSTLISAGDFVETSVGATVRRYVFVAGVGNKTVPALCSSSTGLLITYTAHGFSNNWLVYVSNQGGGSLADGFYYVINAAADTFKISLTLAGSAVAYASETRCEIAGVHNGTYYISAYDSASSSAAVRLDTTGRALVRAINRDPSSVVYGNYVSGVNDVPGKMRLSSIAFVDPIYVRASSAGNTAFSPQPPTSFASGTQVYSRNSTLPAGFFSSKLNEPEAVPLIYYFPAGSASKRTLRQAALRDSVIIIKEDGVFRLTGDNPNNFTVTVLDSTVFCLAKESVRVINNQVVFLSNQGVCLVTESSVDIISRDIEDFIQPILGQTGLAAQTAAIAYETERLYLLTTTTTSSLTAAVTYAYNILTRQWTSWDTVLTQGTIGPGDVCYYFGSSNDVMRERKKQTRVDFSGQQYATTVVSVAADGLSGVVTSAGRQPTEGDMFVSADVITWVTSSVFVSGSNYTVQFLKATNLVAADTPFLYAQFTRRVKFSPIHAGLVGRMKFFAQMIAHFRDNNVSRAHIYFTNDFFAGSEITDWAAVTDSSQEGWGSRPWGFFEWGQEDGIAIQQGTLPASIIDVWVPSQAARCSFIQPVFEFPNAGDMINLQALSFSVRAYGSRESR